MDLVADELAREVQANDTGERDMIRFETEMVDDETELRWKGEKGAGRAQIQIGSSASHDLDLPQHRGVPSCRSYASQI